MASESDAREGPRAHTERIAAARFSEASCGRTSWRRGALFDFDCRRQRPNHARLSEVLSSAQWRAKVQSNGRVGLNTHGSFRGEIVGPPLFLWGEKARAQTAWLWPP